MTYFWESCRQTRREAVLGQSDRLTVRQGRGNGGQSGTVGRRAGRGQRFSGGACYRSVRLKNLVDVMTSCEVCHLNLARSHTLTASNSV